jgi:5-methyltetrahydrofolate--homocysteine methyltransferase
MERAAGGEKDGLPESQNSLEEAPVDDPQALLGRAVLRGDREAVPMLVDAVIEGGMPAAQIVEKLLTPLLEDLGEAFARGEAFLPQMMLAAGAMKAAVGRIRERLAEEAKAQEEALGTAGTPATGIGAKAAGKVLFCTVKGDAHSIGKDICVALLESQGFEVYDLGVDVAPEEVVEVARANDVDVICLSALMTTTLQNMKETVERVYAELPAFAAKGSRVLAVGGAVVTERWAQSVGAAYGADAPACVRIAQAAIKA